MQDQSVPLLLNGVGHLPDVGSAPPARCQTDAADAADRETLLFDRRRSTPAAARVFVSEALGRWGRTGRIEDVLLCVSEFATNSVVHGAPPGGRILVRVERHPTLVRVEVHDGGSRMPVQREPQDGVEGGRGLLLVSAVADHWGVAERQGLGKYVWAVFHDTTAPAG